MEVGSVKQWVIFEVMKCCLGTGRRDLFPVQRYSANLARHYAICFLATHLDVQLPIPGKFAIDTEYDGLEKIFAFK